ncbi:MAG TPA: 3D domain-containing protein [Kofleriaceae bacterium]
MMRVALVLAIVAQLGCKQRPTFHDAAPKPAVGGLLGTFELTYYWVGYESDEPHAAANTTLYDRTCAPIAKVSARFATELSISGAGKLADDRMVTVAGECTCKYSPCFRVIDEPWGVGASNRPLVPFRSLAVDRSQIAIGTALWIEQLAGVDIPGTFPTVHDGCVVADDIGGRIKVGRIDWFVARKPYYREIDEVLHLTKVTLFDGGERCH